MEVALGQKEFEEIWAAGDASVEAFTRSLLAANASKSKASPRDYMYLLLAKLMEAGQDHKDRALKAITLLLAKDVSRFRELVDGDSFGAILECLDVRVSKELRTFATLAIVKLLESAKDNPKENAERKGAPSTPPVRRHEVYLSEFVVSRVKRGKSGDLLIAFSVAAAIFPIVPAIGATLFLLEGFVQSLVPLLQRKAKSSSAKYAALNMLSAACMDKACREAITTHCLDWLKSLVNEGLEKGKGERVEGKDGKDNDNSATYERNMVLAAIVLAKISNMPQNEATSGQTSVSKSVEPLKLDKIVDVESLAKRFADIIMASHPYMKLDSNIRDEAYRDVMLYDPSVAEAAFEALAIHTINSSIKQQMADYTPFLQILKEILSDSETYQQNPSAVFNILALCSNITMYAMEKSPSQEEQRLRALAAFANGTGSRPEGDDPGMADNIVESRCKRVLEAGIPQAILPFLRNMSPGSLNMALKVLLAISKTRAHRAPLIQASAIRELIRVHSLSHGRNESVAPALPGSNDHLAAHTLARLLVSSNPNLVFRSASAISPASVVPLLNCLLNPQPDPALGSGNRNFLPAFEALIALTNLAALASPESANTGNTPLQTVLTRATQPLVENLFDISANSKIHVIALEFIANNALHSLSAELFIPKSQDSAIEITGRFNRILAFADSPEPEIRRAAATCLAHIAGWGDPAIDVLLGVAVIANKGADSALVPVIPVNGTKLSLSPLLGLCSTLETDGASQVRGLTAMHFVLGATDPGLNGTKEAEEGNDRAYAAQQTKQQARRMAALNRELLTQVHSGGAGLWQVLSRKAHQCFEQRKQRLRRDMERRENHHVLLQLQAVMGLPPAAFEHVLFRPMQNQSADMPGSNAIARARAAYLEAAKTQQEKDEAAAEDAQAEEIFTIVRTLVAGLAQRGLSQGERLVFERLENGEETLIVQEVPMCVIEDVETTPAATPVPIVKAAKTPAQIMEEARMATTNARKALQAVDTIIRGRDAEEKEEAERTIEEVEAAMEKVSVGDLEETEVGIMHSDTLVAISSDTLVGDPDETIVDDIESEQVSEVNGKEKGKQTRTLMDLTEFLDESAMGSVDGRTAGGKSDTTMQDLDREVIMDSAMSITSKGSSVQNQLEDRNTFTSNANFISSRKDDATEKRIAGIADGILVGGLAQIDLTVPAEPHDDEQQGDGKQENTHPNLQLQSPSRTPPPPPQRHQTKTEREAERQKQARRRSERAERRERIREERESGKGSEMDRVD